MREVVHADQRVERRLQAGLLVPQPLERTVRAGLRDAPAVRVLHGVREHAGSFAIVEDRWIRELEVGVPQHDERPVRTHALGELRGSSPDPTIGRRREKLDLTVLSERTVDELLDEHSAACDRDHEPADAERPQIRQRPVDHRPATDRDHRGARDVRQREQALGDAPRRRDQDGEIRWVQGGCHRGYRASKSARSSGVPSTQTSSARSIWMLQPAAINRL